MLEDNNEKLIEDAYLEVLGRSVDDDGKKTQLNAMKHRSIGEIKKILRLSPEYKNAYKLILTGKIRKDIAYIENDNIVWIKPDEAKATESPTHLGQKQVMLVSTWGIKCGIATYTEHLLNSINKVQEIAGIFSINNRELPYTVNAAGAGIVHLQHEFGIMPPKFNSNSKVIVTFHTISKNMTGTLQHLESKLNIAGYVAHFEIGRSILANSTQKEVWMIPHGSKIIPCANTNADTDNMKQCARDWLNFDKLFGIKEEEECAFVFGFQSGNKNYGKMAQACKNAGIKLIISGAIHQCGVGAKNIISSNDNVILLGRYLNDMEVDLYALASDILLFDTIPLNHHSCSGAMHRIVGAGRPVICSRTNHFTDIIENQDCLKFGDQLELELKIKEALEKSEEFGNKAIQYAAKTSWENVAKQHLEVYKKYADLTTEEINNGTV